MISRIRNVNCKPFSFSIAYHTYLCVSDISEVRVEGLETLDYLDNLCQKERFTEQGNTLTFETEMLLFLITKKRGHLPYGKKDFQMLKSKSLPDFGDEEYKQMLCIDGAAIEKPITLKPGEEWTGRLELSVISSS
ncbi:hypothetical protein Tsubulata_005650, partial [Turnera subulata]